MRFLNFLKRSFVLLIDTFRSRKKSSSRGKKSEQYASEITDEESLTQPVIITSDPDDPLRIFLSPPTLPNLSINTTNTATAHGGLNVSNHPYCYGSEASSVHSLSPINSFGANSSFGGSRCGSDDANSPLTPSNSSTMSLRDSLRKKLREERIECPRGSGAYIIPRCQQKLLITEDAIKDEARLKGVVIEVEKAQSIREHSMRLFGILAYLRRGAQIVDFMAENITDEQLPLKRDMEDYRNYCLKGPKGETIRLLAERWDDDEREDFYEAQRMMTAPFFELHQHYEFDDSTVLPFIDFAIADGETKEYRGGGYSEIHIRCIHPSHHNFWDRSQPDIYNRVAIKKLIDPDEDDFLKEANILRALAPKRHLHLLRLLATFQQTKSQEGLKWHFVFPCADANLRAYWDKTEPNPKFNERTVLWVLKQMAGITDGLSQVHIHEVVMPLSVKGVGGIRLKEGKTMSVEKGEQWYGRHGDIKPENILWFSKDPEHDDDRGMLKIADFGLGRFHGLDSRSKVPPETIAGTVTYEPPELKLGTPVSRAYDIWSLGCLFLEFITWLLMGAKAVHGFADARAEPYPSAPKMSDDSFFAIIRENGEATSAEVRKGVVKWVRRLHQHEHCTQLIHDLLDLVMEEMLVVDRDERTSATLLYKAFLNFKKKAEENNEYALLPTPWPADEQADPPQAGPSVLTLRRAPTVHFEDEDS